MGDSSYLNHHMVPDLGVVLGDVLIGKYQTLPQIELRRKGPLCAAESDLLGQQAGPTVVERFGLLWHP